jgi:hypothetical protein
MRFSGFLTSITLLCGARFGALAAKWLRAAHEAVNRTARDPVRTGDRPRRVDAPGGREDRAPRIEGGEAAVASAQEAVTHKARVIIISRDLPRWVDA